MKAKIEYSFLGNMWKHEAQGGWHFVSLPKHVSKEIKEHLGWQEEGWGRMKALAKIKKVAWETAIWYDRKKETYILPIKAEIRRKTGLKVNEDVEISIFI